jgi:hypothetical protein
MTSSSKSECSGDRDPRGHILRDRGRTARGQRPKSRNARLALGVAAVSLAPVFVAVLIGGFAAAIAPATARADGDPASDVLATQSLFLPWDADVPATRQARLSAVLSDAEHAGYEVRVALIASRADLGSVGALWQRPQSYAEFLAQEISLLYRGPLLVAMPDGFGVRGAGVSEVSIRVALAGIPAPRGPHGGAQLAEDTILAVRRLAGAAGHRLPASAASSSTIAATARPVPHPGNIGAWIVFVAGALLIGSAWTVSLRVQPVTHIR